VGVANPGLSPLGSYGGPTPTFALLPDSPALNAGTAGGAPATDQRGVPRGSVVSMGAYQATPGVFSFAGLPVSTPAGTPLTFTLTARDSFGQLAAGYRGTVHLTSTDGQATLPGDHTFTAGDAGVYSFGVGMRTAGNQSITVIDTGTGIVPDTEPIAVVPAALDHFRVTTSADGGSTVAGALFDVTVTAQDAYNNTVTGYAGTVTFSSADPYGASRPADYTFQPGDQGQATFPAGAALFTAGTWDVTVADTLSGLSGSANVNVVAGAAVAFQVLGPGSAVSGTPFDITVVAADAYGNTDTHYAGTIHFSSTDPDPGVVLPPDHTFQPSDAGMVTFTGGVTLITPGSQTIRVTDLTSGITGSVIVTL
jgi:hypothetical protein